MKKAIFNGARPSVRRAALAMAVLAIASLAKADGQVETISGGAFQGNSGSHSGYVNGDTLNVAQFHTPMGLGLDSTGNYLFVADRDNNVSGG